MDADDDVDFATSRRHATAAVESHAIAHGAEHLLTLAMVSIEYSGWWLAQGLGPAESAELEARVNRLIRDFQRAVAESMRTTSPDRYAQADAALRRNDASTSQ